MSDERLKPGVGLLLTIIAMILVGTGQVIGIVGIGDHLAVRWVLLVLATLVGVAAMIKFHKARHPN